MYTAEDGREYVRRYGSREEVFDEVCWQTAGKLKKDDLEKRGSRIVSKRRSALGKARFAQKNPFKKVDDEKKPEPAVSDKPSSEPSARRKKGRKRKRERAQVAVV